MPDASRVESADRAFAPTEPAPWPPAPRRTHPIQFPDETEAERVIRLRAERDDERRDTLPQPTTAALLSEAIRDAARRGHRIGYRAGYTCGWHTGLSFGTLVGIGLSYLAVQAWQWLDSNLVFMW